jgi:starch synthase
MSLERPVVAFRVGGIPETLTDGLTGVLVAPGDIDGLARAIMGILDDPAAASRMGSAGRERVLERFTGRAMAESVWKVYLETAGDRRWRRGPRAARGN